MSTEIHYENGTLTVTRVYDAPIEAVFEAWVETSKVQQWWGCAQTTNVRSEIEPRVGGKYNHLMTIDGKHEHPSTATLREYDPPARLVFASEGMRPGDPEMSVSVDFTEVDGGTQVRLVHAGIPDMQVEGGMDMCDIIQGGWTAAFEKLGNFLGAGAAG